MEIILPQIFDPLLDIWELHCNLHPLKSVLFMTPQNSKIDYLSERGCVSSDSTRAFCVTCTFAQTHVRKQEWFSPDILAFAVIFLRSCVLAFFCSHLNDLVTINNYQEIYSTPSERMKNTPTRKCCNFSVAPRAILLILGVCFVTAILFRRLKNFLVRISSRTPERRR